MKTHFSSFRGSRAQIELMEARQFFDYTSLVTATGATLVGQAGVGDILVIKYDAGTNRFYHNRQTSGDSGYVSNFDFDMIAAGTQSVHASAATVINITDYDAVDIVRVDDTLRTSPGSYVVTDHSFVLTGGSTFNYNTIGELTLACGKGNDTIKIESTKHNGPDLTVGANTGYDTIIVGRNGSLDAIDGDVHIGGGGSIFEGDLLIIDDHMNANAGHSYDITDFSVDRNLAGKIWFHNTYSVRVLTSATSDLIEIDTADAVPDFRVESGGGADTFYVNGSTAANRSQFDPGRRQTTCMLRTASLSYLILPRSLITWQLGSIRTSMSNSAEATHWSRAHFRRGRADRSI